MMSLINPVGQTLCSYPAFGLSDFENALNKCKKEMFEAFQSSQHIERSRACVFGSLFNDILSDQSLSEKIANATKDVPFPTLNETWSQNKCQNFLRMFNSGIKNVANTIPMTDKIVDLVSSYFQTMTYGAHNPTYGLMLEYSARQFPRAPPAPGRAVEIIKINQYIRKVDREGYEKMFRLVFSIGVVVGAIMLIKSCFSAAPAAAPAPAAAAPAPAAAAPAPAAAAPAPAAAAPLPPAPAPAPITPTEPPSTSY